MSQPFVGIAYEKRVLSAHRTPGQAASLFKSSKSRGIEVITAAGGAAISVEPPNTRYQPAPLPRCQPAPS